MAQTHGVKSNPPCFQHTSGGARNEDATNGGDYPHDDSDNDTNVKTETGGNIHNGKAVPCDYAARHVAPSEGLD